MGTYLTAQVCLNGHVATDRLEKMPEAAEAHCSRCGEHTITECPNCRGNIRGYYWIEGVVGAGYRYHPPKFCRKCGEALPWHMAKIKAAQELADELDELAADDRKKLKAAINDLTSDTPRTELAAHRYKAIAAKLGRGARNPLTTIMTELVTEAAKKMIFGPGS